MRTWDEHFGIKVGHSESENVFSVNFYDGHVPRFPRKRLDLNVLYSTDSARFARKRGEL
jgi:hypothetical protein